MLAHSYLKLNMKKKSNCFACKQPFDKDPRTMSRQTFCSRAECQRERRRRSQKLRRLRQRRTAQSENSLSSDGINFIRLQSSTKLNEADSMLEDPFIQGLISMLSGTNDLNEVKNTIRRIIERGQKLQSDSLSE